MKDEILIRDKFYMEPNTCWIASGEQWLKDQKYYGHHDDYNESIILSITPVH